MALMDYRQIRQLKEQNKDSILLMRIGDFYEAYGDDAIMTAKELDLTLTGRNFEGMGERVPMTGFPYHSAESYIKKLSDKGHKIAVAESAEQRDSDMESNDIPADGLMIKSEIAGWSDWSTNTLTGNTRKFAEWLIANGYANESDVRSAFASRQTSHMSDDYNAEENDNAAIRRVASKYIQKKDAEQTALKAESVQGNIAACRRVASEYWGEVQREETLINGIYRFDTAGHGGYVVDGNAFNLDKIPDIFFSGTDKKYVVFEEDCDWAALFYYYPEVSGEYYRQAAHTHSPKFYEAYPTHESFFKNCVIETMEAYHKDLLPMAGNIKDNDNQNKNVKEDKEMSSIENMMDDPLFGDGANEQDAGNTGAEGGGGEQKPRMTPEDYIKQADAEYIAAMRDGRYPEIIDGIADFNYSVRNVMLIKSQMPTATKVMGLHAWNYQNRSVIGGEKSLKILAVTNNAEADGDAENGETSGNGKSYRMSYVFDISQTSGKDLKPKTCTPEVMDKYYEGIHRTLADMAKGYTFAEGEKGGIDFAKKIVTLPQGLSCEDELKAMIHAAARIRVEGKTREEGGEVSQGRAMFNAIESSAVTHIAARRLGLGDYPLKTAEFKDFDDDGLMKLTTNLHYVKMGSQRITNAVERPVKCA